MLPNFVVNGKRAPIGFFSLELVLRIFRRVFFGGTGRFCCVKWVLQCCKHPKKALLRSGSKRARTEHAQRTPGVMVSAGLCGKATPQLLGPFFLEDSYKIDSGVHYRILEDSYAPQRCRSSQRQLCGSHCSKARSDPTQIVIWPWLVSDQIAGCLHSTSTCTMK